MLIKKKKVVGKDLSRAVKRRHVVTSTHPNIVVTRKTG